MDFEAEAGSGIDFDAMRNEFTGSLRESVLPPGPDEPICLISYEITHILLGDGPSARSGFWKSYRRELVLNQKTNFVNYHVKVCRHQLMSLGMTLSKPVYFRNGRLTSERQIDAFTANALTDPRFN